MGDLRPTDNKDSQSQEDGNSWIPPRLLIIGAGSRGNAYAHAVTESTDGKIVAVAEPIRFKREALGKKYIWGSNSPTSDEVFENWQGFLEYEKNRRAQQEGGEQVSLGVDGVFVCTLDETHMEIIVGLASLGLNVMSEKPLATTLQDCLKIYRSLQPSLNEAPRRIFSIGHVLHYSPHNILLRKLLLEDNVIGEVISMEHTEPVGWWHFAHSYVRRSRKPSYAKEATNCLSCPAEAECIYSAKRIYEDDRLAHGKAGWPVNIVDPEIEDLLKECGPNSAIRKLRERLAEDYDNDWQREAIECRPWFGRCVYESDNDVCDDQLVTIAWEDEPLLLDQKKDIAQCLQGRGAKTAIFHMVALTEKQCKRRGRIYGTKGEIEYDSNTISVYDFASKETRLHHPHHPGGRHGGGDIGLAQQYVKAIHAIKNENINVPEAQNTHIGCTLDDIIRSHAMVFAAEEARKQKKVIDWRDWWTSNIESSMKCSD